jgi:hypothetical protein
MSQTRDFLRQHHQMRFKDLGGCVSLIREYVAYCGQRQPGGTVSADRAQSLALRLVVKPIARGTASGRHEQTERFVVKERGAREPCFASQSSESQSCHDGKGSRSGERKRSRASERASKAGE